MNTKHPILLLILDGFGHRAESTYNAIAKASTPAYDQLWQQNPHLLISGSGHCVGLPDGQMGNSEVGHLTMGAGRTIYQDYTRIEQAISDGEFFKNSVLINACQQAVKHQSNLHILGLLSPGGVHSFDGQIQACLKLAKQQNVKNVYLHAFLDGRDTPPQSAMASLTTTDALLKNLGNGRIASIIGRYYAMDRDKRWDRIEKAYNLIVEGQSLWQAQDAMTALELAYARGETDEFVQATSIMNAEGQVARMQDNDVIIFMNFRADRTRELSHALLDEHFAYFSRTRKINFADFVTLTQYEQSLPVNIAFPPISLAHLLGPYLSEQGYQQLRIAETEKYAHVTFFFNGGIEKAALGEERLLIPSLKVATYDLQPAMSAFEITDALEKAIQEKKYDFIVCNFANADMVGHTGNFTATVTAIEALDQCLAKITNVLNEYHVELILTADHGNAELMFDEYTKQPHTAHTSELVPCIYKGRAAVANVTTGSLADIAPTILYLFGLPIPEEMTGQVLFELKE